MPPITIRRRWHPKSDRRHGPDPLPWRWTCDLAICPHTSLRAYSRTREDAQREADAHIHVAKWMHKHRKAR